MAPPKKVQERRVFLALDEDHPSQFVSMSRHGHSDGGVHYPARCRVIDEEQRGGHPTGRFVIPANAPDYKEQVQGMRRVVEESKYNIIELGTDDAARLPEWFNKPKTSEKELLIEAQRSLDEKSDLLTRQALEMARLEGSVDTKDKSISELIESNEEMKTELADLKKALAKKE